MLDSIEMEIPMKSLSEYSGRSVDGKDITSQPSRRNPQSYGVRVPSDHLGGFLIAIVSLVVLLSYLTALFLNLLEKDLSSMSNIMGMGSGT